MHEETERDRAMEECGGGSETGREGEREAQAESETGGWGWEGGHGDSERREGARRWEMEILYNLKWLPLPPSIPCSAASPSLGAAANEKTASVFNTELPTKDRTLCTNTAFIFFFFICSLNLKK